jgi:hypothetical protein
VFISTARYRTTTHSSSLLEGAPWLHYHTHIAHHQLALGEAGKKRAADKILSRATPQSIIHICSVPQRKIVSQNLSMQKVTSLAEYFCMPLLVWIFQIRPNPIGKIRGKREPQNPSCDGLASAWKACPWKHMPSSSAPCVVPMRLSRISQHIKDEPCTKCRALLGVLSRHY